MTLFEMTREAADETVHMYFEPIVSLFRLAKRERREQRFGLAQPLESGRRKDSFDAPRHDTSSQVIAGTAKGSSRRK